MHADQIVCAEVNMRQVCFWLKCALNTTVCMTFDTNTFNMLIANVPVEYQDATKTPKDVCVLLSATRRDCRGQNYGL